MPEIWQDQLLGDLVTFQRGYDITKKEQEPGPYPVISSSGVSSTHREARVGGPGVVIGRKGSLGGVYYSATDFWPHDTTLWVRDFHGNNPRFVFYFLKTLGLQRFDVGASNPTLNRNHIHLIPIRSPDTRTQLKIGAALAAYDELMENNLRRIGILEEMARAIYREWFVSLRYPGHEAEELVDSALGPIPMEWGVGPFSRYAEFINGYAFKPSHWQDAGKPIVKIKELKNGVTDETPRYHGDDLDKKYHIDTGDLLFSWSADLNAYLWRHGPALLNQHLFKVEPRDGLEPAFLFHALDDRMPQFRQRAQGTTMRHIKRAALSEVQVVVPSAEVRGRFVEAVDPMHRLLEALAAQNANLRSTRDLLLPKLVSGEIDVSDLDIDTSWLAA